MLHDERQMIKLETNKTLAWFQCHPRASLYLFTIGTLNVLLNLADLFWR
jgi:hypothetical protein